MKSCYEKPMIEFEEYVLNTAIAVGCGSIVSLGPDDGVHPVCEEYDQPIFRSSRGINDANDGTFYEGSCSCYLNAGMGELFTS